jgi:hypothetical protein
MPIIPTGYEEIRGRARALAVVLLIGAIGGVLYWVAFFTSGAVQASDLPCYLVFERAFPAADAWGTVTALVAAAGLWRGRPAAVLFGIAAASAMLFLGLMDVLYNVENHMYALANAEMAGEVFINAYCFFVGPTLMTFVWRHRRALGA